MSLMSSPCDKRVFIKSFGCQMNQYDAARMVDVLSAVGYTPTEEASDADLIILNTCHIREKAVEKVYSDIGRLRDLKQRKHSVLIAVAGCVAQAEGEEIMKRAPAVELVFGPQTYQNLPKLLDAVASEREKNGNASVVSTEFPVEEKFADLPQTRYAPPSAHLTIQEGCDKFCTFCVVPYTRGAEFSRPLVDVCAEAENLVAHGAKEIVLLGQNVNAYRGDSPQGSPASLAGLIRKLSDIPGLKRIRYTTSHPRDVTDEQIAVHAEVESCMPYLHLPVQSGSDKILAAMNRQHCREDYLKTIDKLRNFCPDIALSSDFIVGFPGETEKDFEETLSLVREVGFAQAYSFKYSARPGTPAATHSVQIPENLKTERLTRLQSLLNTQRRHFNDRFLGQTIKVLFEQKGKRQDQIIGRSPHMQTVHISSETAERDNFSIAEHSLIGKIIPVEIIACGTNSLEGRITSSNAFSKNK